jgi:ligand-binding sensor domain-containing protein/signal transduction histidine kinase
MPTHRAKRLFIVPCLAGCFFAPLVPSGFCAPFPADPVPIRHWGTDEGLAPGLVSTMLQSRDGYLWIGADEGLMRFDGARCTVFDSRNTPELRVNLIFALHEDRQDRLWIGTGGGGLVCRFPDGRFQAYGPAEGLSNEQIRAISEDAGGRLWIGTDGGGLFEFKNDRVSAFAGNASLPSQFIRSLAPAGDGSLWVGSNGRLCRIKNGQVETDVAVAGPNPRDTVALLPDTEGGIWVGGSEGLFKLERGRFTQFGIEAAVRRVQALRFGADGRLWIGTVNGLVRFDRGRFFRMTTDQGLSGNMISCVFRDREGSLWIGGDVSGVDQIRFTKFAFLSTQHGLSHPITTSVCEDREGALWIGSHMGVNRYAQGQMTHWTKRDGLSANQVFTVCEDSKGGMWIGTVNGLNHLVNGKLRTYTQRDGLPSNVFWCLYRDKAGTVWAGTVLGVVRLGENGFQTLHHDNSGLSHNDVRVIAEDAAGRLWVGTSHGLNRLDDGRFVSYVNSGPDRPLNVVLALHADREGDLWIGTMAQGLLRFRDGKFTSFTREFGLHDNLVYQILEDDVGHLWLSCNRGIYQVSKAELNAFADGRTSRIHCTVFGKSDGLLSTECNGTIQPAGWKARDGRLWFPTAKGVAVIDPQRLPRNERPPHVVIEEIVANGASVVASDLTKLGPNIHRLEIRYTGLSYVAPELVKFRYRLDGLDPEWSEPTADRVARYTHLSPGHYRFTVTACNNDGVWSEKGITMAFIVVPAWWQTAWFVALAVVAFAGSIGGAARLITVRRYRRRMAELERQHALERERTRIARDMHDGLGSDLVKISLLGEIAEGQMDDSESLRPRLQKITRTAREAVRDMDEIVWAVNPKNDTVENLASYLCQFAREHFEVTSARLHLDVPPNLPHHSLSADVRHNLLLVVKEALNNAVKHAEAADVWLRLSAKNGTLDIEVEDNGRGMSDPEPGRKGHGMVNLQTRTAQIRARLNVYSQPGQGTRITINLNLT